MQHSVANRFKLFIGRRHWVFGFMGDELLHIALQIIRIMCVIWI